MRKLGSTAAAKVLRREHGRGQGVWWGATATHCWRSREECCRHRRDAPARREGDVPAEAGKAQQQLKSYDGSMVVGREFCGGLPQPTAAERNAVPPSSDLSDGDGVAVGREVDVPSEVGTYSSSLSPTV